MANIHFCAFCTKTPVCFCAHFTLKILDYELNLAYNVHR